MTAEKSDHFDGERFVNPTGAPGLLVVRPGPQAIRSLRSPA
jgi:hypothetical protein